MQKEMNAKQDNSAVAKLVARIIDNFQLRISHVHIRFEDHSYSLECFLSLGRVLVMLLPQESFWKNSDYIHHLRTMRILDSLSQA